MKKQLLFIIVGLSMVIGINGQTLLKLGDTSITLEKHQSNAFTGYFNITDIGLMIGSTSNAHVAPFSFLTTNGYHFTEQLSAGLGIGVEFTSGTYMPIVLDTRYYIRNTSFSPFVSFYGGYTIPLDDDGMYYYNSQPIYSSVYYGNNSNYIAKGGWLLNPGFGVRKMFSEDFGIIFSVGYRFQRLHYTGDNDRRLFTDSNRLTLKIGITFR